MPQPPSAPDSRTEDWDAYRAAMADWNASMKFKFVTLPLSAAAILTALVFRDTILGFLTDIAK